MSAGPRPWGAFTAVDLGRDEGANIREQGLRNDQHSKMDDNMTEIVNSRDRLPDLFERMAECNAKVAEAEEALAVVAPRFDLEAYDASAEQKAELVEDRPAEIRSVPQGASGALRDRIESGNNAAGEEQRLIQLAVSAPLDDVSAHPKGALLLRIRRAFWMRKLEKLRGMYVALLPCVCAQQVMTNQRLAPEKRAVLCEYMFVQVLLYHFALNAPDLRGRHCLPPQRRSKVRKDVLVFGNAMIKRLLTWSYLFSQFIVGCDDTMRIVTIGTMQQEHYNAILRRLCYGDDCAYNLDGSMTRADMINWLRAQQGLLPHEGASRERTVRGDAHMPSFDGAGVPPLSYIVKCAVVSMDRFGVSLPQSVQKKLESLDMMPDLAAWGAAPSFVHELVPMGGPVRIGKVLSTTGRKSTNMAGVSKMKLYASGRQLALGGKLVAKGTELRRVQRAHASSDEEDV